MRVEIILDGKTYVGINDCAKTVEEIAVWLKNELINISSFKLALHYGGYLVIGKEACSRAVFIVCG